MEAKSSTRFAAVCLVATAIRDHSKQTAEERKEKLQRPFLLRWTTNLKEFPTKRDIKIKGRPDLRPSEDGGTEADLSLI